MRRPTEIYGDSDSLEQSGIHNIQPGLKVIEATPYLLSQVVPLSGLHEAPYKSKSESALSSQKLLLGAVPN